jgi:hypothetical protein
MIAIFDEELWTFCNSKGASMLEMGGGNISRCHLGKKYEREKRKVKNVKE